MEHIRYIQKYFKMPGPPFRGLAGLLLFFLIFFSYSKAPAQPSKTVKVTHNNITWEQPRFDSRTREREKMVAQQIEARKVDDPRVLEAMRNVPRHLFVPEQYRDAAYEDRPLPIGHGQTISQPFIVAYMTAILDLSAGDKVLEIGTGSSYQAAVLSEMTPNVYTIEIIEPLGRQAIRKQEQLQYNTINTMIEDGYFGWEEHAPFDAIIVTAASGHVPPPLIKQLKPNGTMVIPIGSPYQTQNLMKVTKNKNGKMRTQSLMPVRFVPMTGAAEEK